MTKFDVSGENAEYIEQIYSQYQQSSGSVSDEWRLFFENNLNITNQTTTSEAREPQQTNHEILKANYRKYGHYYANLNPLKELYTTKRDRGSDGMHQTNQELEKIYASPEGIAFEYDHISDQEQRKWWIDKLEKNGQLSGEISKEQRVQISDVLHRVEAFERFLHKRFQGEKRFSIEGSESAITVLDTIINLLAQTESEGENEVVIGMSHRGRLNVMTNILNKPYAYVMAEFKAPATPARLSKKYAGDVKYHMGWNSTKTVNAKNIKLTLLPNPSHLEAIDPVLCGFVRAKQDAALAHKIKKQIMPVLLHGDASFCGQGVVYESLCLNDVAGYSVGGVVHIIINNQIGFTTGVDRARSAEHPTGVAKSIDAPIIHVNANYPESAYRAAKIAYDYRGKFKKDVVINVIGYRKYGHNEGDDPTVTQPQMYELIAQKKSVAVLYTEQLLQENVMDTGYAKKREDDLQALFEEAFIASENVDLCEVMKESNALRLSDVMGAEQGGVGDDGVSVERLREIAMRIYSLPDGLNINPKLKKMFSERIGMIVTEDDPELDWGFAEALCYGSLLCDGVSVRISGQDVERGTFAHRNSVLNTHDGGVYIPLNNVNATAKYYPVNSFLSEYAVLGFEYGYSVHAASNEINENLVIWEAQFGDFFNGAQIIIDQFISSAETKWLQQSNLVMLLPHGYDGMGPEHSSARIERFLQLAADDNMYIANCSTPASFFHILRRQARLKNKKPLVVFTPKSLLRHRGAVSRFSNLASGNKFDPVIGEVDSNIDPKNVKTLVICSGKIYYELYDARRQKGGAPDMAIIRLEQLYPFPEREIQEQIALYGGDGGLSVIWCQEEPKNQGAFPYISTHIADVMYCGRGEGASPAVGSKDLHMVEQGRIIDNIFYAPASVVN